jgi:PAS domain S-box-containing protein/diguanylate cyclase (GGDEF)-like protein
MAKILVVDDRSINRQYLATVLGHVGHGVLEAGSGEAALAAVRAEVPDLVICDMLMPTMDGFEFVQHLRRDVEHARTPVIFCTATYGDQEARALADSCGVRTILPKFCEPREVLAAVSHELGSAAPSAPPPPIGKAGAIPRRPAVDDTLSLYFKDILAAKQDLERAVERGARQGAERERVKPLWERLSGNVNGLQRIASRLSALVEIGMEMTEERDPGRLLELFFRAACRTVDASYAALAIFDDAAQAPSHVLTQALDASVFGGQTEARSALLEALLEGRRAQRAHATQAEPALEGLPRGHPPVRSFLGVAIATRESVYGWLYFAEARAAQFSDEDERLAAILAAQLALAYEHTRLYDLVQKHAARLQIEAAERGKAQEALVASEARYRSMFEQAGAGIVHTSLDGRLLSANPKFCSLTGYAHEELTRLGIRELTHPDDLQRSLEFRSRLASGAGGAYERELRLVRKDGSVIWVNITTSLVHAPGGEPPYFVSVLIDISERKRAEREARRFRLAMDQSLDSIYLTDLAAMRFVYVNDTACRRLGYPRERLLEMGPQDVLSTDREQLRHDYERVVAAGEAGTRSESVFVRSDGSQGWTELHRRAMHIDDEALLVTTGRDITERKRAEERIMALSRVHAMLSGINAAILRVRDRAALAREACRIAIEAGQFRFAWLGVVDPAGERLEPLAWAGDEGGFIEAVTPRMSLREDPPEGPSIAVRAVREKTAVVVNDVANDPQIRFKKLHAERGIRAAAILPLFVAGKVVGALGLHAGAAGFFDDEELRLLHDLAGDIGFAFEHMERAERLDYLAFYDALTGLANRHLFIERLNQYLQAAGPAGEKAALVLTDIERLRTVNESLGRHAGDALLKEVAARLARGAAPSELARIGADHFAIVLRSVKGRSEIARRFERLWGACLSDPVRLEGTELRISAKAGITVFPTDGANAETLLQNAETALRRAKQLGERYLFYSAALTGRPAEKLTLENKLRQALEKNEFVLHYQPQVDLENRRIAGVEALIRWQSPELGLVPPGQFIPLMEETGLILDVGAWALVQAVQDQARWLAQGPAAPRVAVNVSAIQLRRKDYVDTVAAALKRGATPPGIDLEITESLVMEDIEANIAKLKGVRELGLNVAIDDFGTGYSSLGYLAKLPVQALKIDRSFIVTMLDDPAAMTLVQTIIALAHTLRLKVVAEGVDSEEQAKLLRLLRCDGMQGFLFSRPLPFDEMTALLRRNGMG